MNAANQPAEDHWAELRLTTQARIGLGRAGNSLPSRRVLEFKAAHSAARDAVHEPLDIEDLTRQISDLDIEPALHVQSQADSRSEYLRRPDLGRQPADLSHLPDTGADLAIVLADGLSPRALADHGRGLLQALLDTLGERYSLAPPVIATQARVALGDHIGEALRAQTMIMVIGERPGLSVADSLGIYLTICRKPGAMTPTATASPTSTRRTASTTQLPPRSPRPWSTAPESSGDPESHSRTPHAANSPTATRESWMAR